MTAPKPWEADYFCSMCRAPFVSESSLDESGRCTLCSSGTRHFEAAYSFGSYDGELRSLVHLFKYRRIRALDRRLGAWIASALPRDEEIDAIVPVPLNWRRQWSRGFNQAELLAQAVSHARRAPVLKGALRRVKDTRAQASLSAKERAQNLARAFRVAKPAQIANQRILLVDDVFTTGSTAAGCARVLKSAGARSVVLLTLARADRRWQPLPQGEKLSGAS